MVESSTPKTKHLMLLCTGHTDSVQAIVSALSVLTGSLLLTLSAHMLKLCVTNSCFVFQVNEWQSDWPSFFIRHRLQAQLDLIEKDYGDREARELWSQLKV